MRAGSGRGWAGGGCAAQPQRQQTQAPPPPAEWQLQVLRSCLAAVQHAPLAASFDPLKPSASCPRPYGHDALHPPLQGSINRDQPTCCNVQKHLEVFQHAAQGVGLSLVIRHANNGRPPATMRGGGGIRGMQWGTEAAVEDPPPPPPPNHHPPPNHTGDGHAEPASEPLQHVASQTQGHVGAQVVRRTGGRC